MCVVLRVSIYSLFCMFNIVLIPPAQTRARHLRMSSSFCKYLYICIWLEDCVYRCGALYRACALSLHTHIDAELWKPHRIHARNSRTSKAVERVARLPPILRFMCTNRTSLHTHTSKCWACGSGKSIRTNFMIYDKLMGINNRDLCATRHEQILLEMYKGKMPTNSPFP